MQRKSTPRKSTRRPQPQAPLRLQRQRAVQSPKPAMNRRSVAAAYATGLRSSAPKVTGNFNKTNIKHRELVTSVTGSVAFTVQNTFSINPGLAATFPWLSTQAVGWEQYRFNRIKFCYYTRTGSTTPGSVLLVPDYDAADAAPATEQIASAYRDVVEEVPWVEEFSCILDNQAMFSMGPKKFIRTTTLSANQDIKTYDAANFYVCTVDGTAVNWGKLWVEYDVDFYVPQLPPSGSTTSVAFGKVVSGGSVSNTAIYGTAATVTGSLIASASASTLTLSTAGSFILTVFCIGTGMGNAGTLALTGTATTTALSAVTSDYANLAVTADTNSFLVVTSAAGQTVVINWSTVTSVTSSVARLSVYNST